MTQGIKVSKPTKNIYSTEPRDYVLNSEYNTAVIYKEEEISVTIPANTSVSSTVSYYEPDGTTPKTFDFYPVVLVYVQLNSAENKWYLSPFTFQSGDSIDTYIVYHSGVVTSYVGKSNFVLHFHNQTSSQKIIKYRYYLHMNLV